VAVCAFMSIGLQRERNAKTDSRNNILLAYINKRNREVGGEKEV